MLPGGGMLLLLLLTAFGGEKGRMPLGGGKGRGKGRPRPLGPGVGAENGGGLVSGVLDVGCLEGGRDAVGWGIRVHPLLLLELDNDAFSFFLECGVCRCGWGGV